MNGLRNQLRWINHHRVTLLALLLGVMMATSLAATGPVLIDQVLTFAFRRALLNAPVEEVNGRISFREALDETALDAIDSQIQSSLTPHLAPLPHTIISSGILPTSIPWQGDQIFTSQRLNIQFYDADWQARVELLAGELPQSGAVETAVYAVAIGEPLAQAYGLQVGDRIPISKQTSAVQPDFWLQVSGIVQPLDAQEPFWFGALSPLRVREDGRFRHYGALVPKETFHTIAATHFPDQTPSFLWYLLFDMDNLALPDAPLLQERLATLPDLLTPIDRQLLFDTDLPERVATFEQNAGTVRTPLTLLTATSTLLAFFFVGMVATLAGVQLHAEWSLQRSRGVAEARLFWVQMGRTVALLLLGYGLGLWLSLWLLRRLAVAGPLAEIRDPDWLLTATQVGWQPALLAALFCLLLIIWPFIRASRHSATRQRQQLYRPETDGWFQRYYIDVMVVAIGLILLIRFVGQGGLMQNVGGAAGADWLLVLAPIATMIGGLTILLRLFPRLLLGLSRLYQRWPRSAPYLALMYAARFHQQSTRLVLLFALTVALGIFSASVDDALSHNEAVRARYATGGAVRLIGVGGGGEAEDLAETAVWRGDAKIDTVSSTLTGRFDLLAIDPEPFMQLVEIRDNFADPSLETLLGEMTPPEVNLGANVAIPPEATSLGVWMTISDDTPENWEGVSLQMKVMTDAGAIYNLPLAFSGETDGAWRYFSAQLPDPSPVLLNSIWLRSRTYRPQFREKLAYDDISYTDQNGARQILTGFENLVQNSQTGFTWFRVNPQQDVSVFYVPSNFEPRSGNVRLEFGFGQSGVTPGRWYGVARFDREHNVAPLFPILVSRRFVEQTGANVGDQMVISARQSPVSSHSFLARVVGVVDYFPTMYEQSEMGYVVTLRDPLIAAFNSTRFETMGANELLLAERPFPALLNQASQVITLTDVEQTLRAFPLAVGLRTASLLSYILATAISLGGFVAHLLFLVTQRRAQFVVLQALGLNGRQLYGVLLIEQLVLLFFGLLLGTGLGLLLTWLTLNNLNFDWGGIANAPMFEAVWDWRALWRTYALFGLMVLAGLGTAVLIIRRTGMQRTLRMAVE